MSVQLLMPGRPTITAYGVAGLAALWLAMMLWGAGEFDRFLLAQLYAADRPVLRQTAALITLLGNWQTVVVLSILAAAWLAYRRKVRLALLLLAITLVGRSLVIIQKVAIARLRPDGLEHLVNVNSLSFPSGHAANSMILLLSLAMIAGPREQRWWTVPAAVGGSLLVGISRPMLGVHYPSDVVGGWAFGAAWVLMMLAMAERWPARRERPA